ncbi:MAG: hypothetical protein COV45_03850 [Deltaproteobacteria bacterium CG11_big_fil_rev_8_21_14_0_20_47_16]|nr:MAG: hypothetical protein COV45_03850 [Deltaproteobacteria bacterium CG11_big_fil_rev_8_21_14_0_20_47_16]
MQRLLSIITVLLLGASFARAEILSSNIIDLDQCFLMAVRRSETLQMKEEDINQAAAKFSQALGAVLPQLAFKGTELLQDVPSSDQAANNSTSISSTFLRRSIPNTSINLTQPIFSGLKEFRTMAGLKASQKRLRHEHQRAAQLLYRDVAQSFYTVLQVQTDIAILVRQESVLRKRIAELRDRAKVGRSRESEIAATEAQEANVAAALSEIRGTLLVAREMLEFLTGVSINQKIQDSKPASNKQSIDYFLESSESRDDVLAASIAVQEAQNNLKVSGAGYSPTISLSANYYPYRVGFYEPIKWDATFYLTLPIFQGNIRGQIQEAKSKLVASELNEQLTRRQSEQDIRSAYSTWKSTLSQMNSYNRAAQKNRINYEAQTADYQTNLVSNLEVLQAFADWLNAERRANQLRFQAKVNYAQLLVASGKIPGTGISSAVLNVEREASPELKLKDRP